MFHFLRIPCSTSSGIPTICAQLIRIKLEAVSLDSTVVKVHPDGTGARKKTAPKPSESPAAGGPPRSIWLPRMLERH